MKAIVCPRYGGPEVLELRDLPMPECKPDGLLVKVHATAVNSGDARIRGLQVKGPMRLMMRLVLGWNKPRQPVLGTVYTGVVEAVGADVTALKPGDVVWGCTPGLSLSTHAEVVAVPEASAVAKKPASLSFQDAAALLFGGTTALFFLQKAGARAGQHALVYGASGAVGTAAVQIARNLGLKVTAVASARNEELVRGLGADEFLDYTAPGFQLPGQQYDVVFDAVGKLTTSAGKAALKPGGAFVTVGGAAVSKETKEHLNQLAQWAEAGKLTPVIDRVWPLEEAAAAHALVDSGRKRGSAVLLVQPQTQEA